MELFIASVLPSTLLLFVVFVLDKYQNRNYKLLIESVSCGLLMTLSSLILENIIQPFSSNLFFQSFIVAALIEEGFKFFFLYILIFRNRVLSTPYDTIKCFLTASLVFATIENVLYVTQYYQNVGFEVAYLRMYSAVPMHAILGVSMGYLFYLSRIHLDYILLSFTLLIPIILHGFYDYWALNEMTTPLLITLLGTYILHSRPLKLYLSRSEPSSFENKLSSHLNSAIMKKYFLFDDEPVSGLRYLLRFFIGTLLSVLLVGLWTLSALGYKRANALGWQKELSVLAAIFIPLTGFMSVMLNDPRIAEMPFSLFHILFGIGSIFHLILLFSNGNLHNQAPLNEAAETTTSHNKNTSNQNYVEQPIANNKETKSETTFSEKSVENSVKRKEKLPIQKIVKSKSEEINPQKSNIKPKFCGDCGTSLASAKNFCANCGNKL